MAVIYTGQVQAFALGFTVQGFQKCEGQVLPIRDNPALFSLLMTTYGGDGMTTYALPDLRKAGKERGLSYQIRVERGVFPERDYPARFVDTYLGAIGTYASTWIPGGTAQCDGRLVEAGANDGLFNLLKTRYGGNGTTNVGTPNLEQIASEDNLRYAMSVQGVYPTTDRGLDDESFIGEVQAFAFDFAPKNWLPCAGQLLPAMENQALYTLIGNTFGGTPNSTFQLPDLRPFSEKHGVNYCICVTGLFPSRW